MYSYSGGTGSWGYQEYKVFDINSMEEYVIDNGEDIAEQISVEVQTFRTI